MEMRFALDRGDRAAALVWAGELLDLYRADAGSRAMEDATALGRTFVEELHAPDAARVAFDIAATASLRSIVEAHRATCDLPELAEATPYDWELLARYRQRLASGQRDLLDTVAAHLRPGEPAFDLLASNDLFRLCAWCGRVRASDDHWLPVAHFLPPDDSPRVTHGICPDCRTRFFGPGYRICRRT
jgi:hypothetical protein